jgi:hypothetical protein
MTRIPNAETLCRMLQTVLDESYGDPEQDVMSRLPGFWAFSEAAPPGAPPQGYGVTAAISPHLNRAFIKKKPLAAGEAAPAAAELEVPSGSLWAAVKQALNPFACQERIQQMVEEVSFTLVVTRCGQAPGCTPLSWILERTYRDFELVRQHILDTRAATEGEPPRGPATEGEPPRGPATEGEPPRGPEPPALPADLSHYGGKPNPAALAKLLQGLDAFVRHVVKHHKEDPVVGNLLGINRKYREGGSVIPGLDSWEEHWSEKFQQVYYHNKLAKVTIWERPAGYEGQITSMVPAGAQQDANDAEDVKTG